MKNKAAFRADRILSYFQEEWVVLLAVTISGLIYNLGLLAGPWFEGKMTGYLVDILGGTKVFSDMLVLVICYVHQNSDAIRIRPSLRCFHDSFLIQQLLHKQFRMFPDLHELQQNNQ